MKLTQEKEKRGSRSERRKILSYMPSDYHCLLVNVTLLLLVQHMEYGVGLFLSLEKNHDPHGILALIASVSSQM